MLQERGGTGCDDCVSRPTPDWIIKRPKDSRIQHGIRTECRTMGSGASTPAVEVEFSGPNAAVPYIGLVTNSCSRRYTAE